MAGTALPGGLSPQPPAGPPPGRWQHATVIEVRSETARAKTFRLKLAVATPRLAGQHFVVRLTAPDGYRASRSYSVASAPGDESEIELTVERLSGGEVSGFLHDVVVPGDELEVRGPIGGWFVWQADRPALLVGGGSGTVPLMAMLRLARLTGCRDLAALLVSVRSPEELFYASELIGNDVHIAYTRRAPTTATRAPGRLRLEDLAPLLVPDATIYVSGSAAFADHATALALQAGADAAQIRVERFGPST